MRHNARIALAIAGAALAISAAGCAASPHVTAKGHASAQPPAAPATPASPAPSTPEDLSGPLGTPFTVTTTDPSGNDDKYDVAAIRILDPARGADEFTTPDAGKRFIGVKFTITGDSGYSEDDANNDAVIQGSDGQTYTPDFDSISAGTNFNNGDFGVTAGHAQTGWVTFQVPRGVSVQSVQWQPGLGDSQPATWTTGG